MAYYGGEQQEHYFGFSREKNMVVYDGKRMRKPIQRKTVDFNSTVIEHIKVIYILKKKICYLF